MTDSLHAEPRTDTGESPWDTQRVERDYQVREIDGVIPETLRGVLYRIGPGRLDVGGHPMGHIFDGDGMVSRIALTPSGVHYRNRYVRTRAYHHTNETGAPPRGFCTQRAGGPLANALRFPCNTSNTSVLVHDDALYSLWEGGRPHHLDPDTLETFGTESFGGALKRLGAFSAHLKVDPTTGEVFNFGLDFFPRPVIRCYRLVRGQMFPVRTVPIRTLGFVHDFALTKRHMVFILGPLVVRRPIPVALGLRPFDDALSYQPQRGTTIVLVPRDGAAPTTIECDAMFNFHVTNAYDSGDEVIAEIVTHEFEDGWSGWNKYLRDYRGNMGSAFGGTLTRLRIDRRRATATRETVHENGCEFPQLDPRRATREHRYSYVAEASRTGGEPDSIVTIDHRSGRSGRYTVDDGATVCEPLFAADPDADGAEGQGWLLSLEHVPALRRSRLLVLPADDPGRGPVATATLEHHVPMTFHGAFTASQ